MWIARFTLYMPDPSILVLLSSEWVTLPRRRTFGTIHERARLAWVVLVLYWCCDLQGSYIRSKLPILKDLYDLFPILQVILSDKLLGINAIGVSG
jgi:hypothetical protein